mgnify:CR=1 FL=1
MMTQQSSTERSTYFFEQMEKNGLKKVSASQLSEGQTALWCAALVVKLNGVILLNDTYAVAEGLERDLKAGALGLVHVVTPINRDEIWSLVERCYTEKELLELIDTIEKQTESGCFTMTPAMWGRLSKEIANWGPW